MSSIVWLLKKVLKGNCDNDEVLHFNYVFRSAIDSLLPGTAQKPVWKEERKKIEKKSDKVGPFYSKNTTEDSSISNRVAIIAAQMRKVK